MLIVDEAKMKHTYGFDQGASRDVGVLFIDEKSKTLSNGSCPGHHNGIVKVEDKMSEYIVRRLTPKECGRLQGFPDGYCDDVPHSDSAEYKLWGNGIALPCIVTFFQVIRKIEEEGR